MEPISLKQGVEVNVYSQLTFIEANKELTREAARIKAKKRMSYADCFAVALARLKKAEFYTGDKELKAVGKDIEVVWL